MTGATMTWHGSPASVTARTRSSRALGEDVPGSSRWCSPSSPMAIETPKPTWTSRAAAVSSGRSRFAVVPLVRIENGVPDPARAAMIPGISR